MSMNYEKQAPSHCSIKVQPRIVIHGGAGNIVRKNFPEEKYKAYRSALLTIVRPHHSYGSTVAAN